MEVSYRSVQIYLLLLIINMPKCRQRFNPMQNRKTILSITVFKKRRKKKQGNYVRTRLSLLITNSIKSKYSNLVTKIMCCLH